MEAEELRAAGCRPLLHSGIFHSCPPAGDSPSPREDSYNTEFTPIALLRGQIYLALCWFLPSSAPAGTSTLMLAFFCAWEFRSSGVEEQSSVDTQDSSLASQHHLKLCSFAWHRYRQQRRRQRRNYHPIPLWCWCRMPPPLWKAPSRSCLKSEAICLNIATNTQGELLSHDLRVWEGREEKNCGYSHWNMSLV